MKKIMLFAMLLLCQMSLFLAGCGGGGGGGGSNSSGISLFATDSFDADHSHVWVKIHEIDIKSDSGTQKIFDDSTGRVVDLKSLRDNTGARFAFLGNGQVPVGTYTSVIVKLAKSVSLVNTGTTTVVTKSFRDALDDGTGKSMIEFAITPRALSGGADDLVVDFDLANFVDDGGGKIGPSVKEGSKSGLDDHARHESEDYRGTISDLAGAAPNQTFTLNGPGGGAVTVFTNDQTSIFKSSGGTNPSLSLGLHVEVGGIFDRTARRIIASKIKIEDGGTEDDYHAVGTVAVFDGTAGTITIAATRVEGFVPASTNIDVTTSDSTIFRASSGLSLTKGDFFTAMSAGRKLELEGTYNPTNNTFTARKAKYEDEDHGGREAEARGAASQVNTTTGHFVLQLAEYEGFVPTGSSVEVHTTAETEYRDGHLSLTKSQFFAAASTVASIKVHGSYSNGVITASEALIIR